MLNHIVQNALNDLRNEANCYKEKRDRQMAMDLISVLEKHFDMMDARPGPNRDNPPGKVVIRDEEGNVTGLQG